MAADMAFPDEYGIPDNPFLTAESIKRERERNADSVRGAYSDGKSKFAAPASPEIPEWLNIARQNNLPMNRNASTPRVRPAARQTDDAAEGATDILGRPIRSRQPIDYEDSVPQSAGEYEMAGYPVNIVREQRDLEQEENAVVHRKRHGAQMAANPYHVQKEGKTAYPKENQVQQSSEQVSVRTRRSRVSANAEPSRQVQHPQAAQSARELPRSTEVAARQVPRQPQGLAERMQYAQQIQPEVNPVNPYAVMPQPVFVAQVPVQQPPVQEDFDYKIPERIEEEKPRVKIPVVASLLLVVALFILGGVLGLKGLYLARMTALENERAETARRIETNHPLRYRELLETKATKYNLDPAFVAAIVLNESSFDTNATSSVNARGLMQLMDPTAQWIYGKLKLEREYSFDDMYSADINVEFGCWYLNYLAGLFNGDPILVAAAYHAGQGEISNWLNNSSYSKDGVTIPLDKLPQGPTKTYVTRVLSAFSVYKRLYYEEVQL